MNISVSEAISSYEESSCEPMSSLIKSANMEMMKRSAASTSDAECFRSSLGTGPLWWS